jgi:hypothetical protein
VESTGSFCSVLEVALAHAFIEAGQLEAAACDPLQKIANYIEAPPSALTGKPVFGEARRVALALRTSQAGPSPSSLATAFWMMMASTRSGCLSANRKLTGPP